VGVNERYRDFSPTVSRARSGLSFSPRATACIRQLRFLCLWPPLAFLSRTCQQHDEAAGLQPFWQSISPALDAASSRVPRSVRTGSKLLGLLLRLAGVFHWDRGIRSVSEVELFRIGSECNRECLLTKSQSPNVHPVQLWTRCSVFVITRNGDHGR